MKKLFKIVIFIGYLVHLAWIGLVLFYGKDLNHITYHFLGLTVLGTILIYISAKQ